MAQEDYFLKIDGIEGESQDDTHKNEIQILSFSFGASNMGSGAVGMGSGSSKVNVQDVNLSKLVDKSSPNLFGACCNGKHFPTATLTIRKAGETPMEYLVYKLSEVFVSSINQSGHGGGIVQESLSLNFSKIEMNYWPQKADGSKGAVVPKTFDVKANKVS